MDALVSTIEQVIVRISGRQYGIIAWREMIAAGISPEQIRHRVRIGLLIQVYRGVYSVGGRPLSVEARYMAGVKACGEGAVLCGRAAAYLLGILKGSPAPAPEVATRNHRRIPGLKTRRIRLDRRDVAHVKRIPCTTPACTIVDLAQCMDDDPFARVCHEAGVLHKTTPGQVKAVMARRGRCNGAPRIRRVMEGDAKVKLSVVEDEFIATLVREGLPLPDTNRRVGKYRVDCRWIDLSVTVELVSYRYHSSRHAWERDHDREREARSRDDDWRSFTFGDVMGDQSYMLRELRKLLRRR